LWPPTHTSNSIFDSLIFQGNEFYLTLDFMCLGVEFTFL